MKPENIKYYCNLIFCTSPVNKKFRYGDLFQLCPLPEDYKLDYGNPTHFPVLIEYSVNLNKVKAIKRKELEGIEDFISESTLQNNWLQLLIKLL